MLCLDGSCTESSIGPAGADAGPERSTQRVLAGLTVRDLRVRLLAGRRPVAAATGRMLTFPVLPPFPTYCDCLSRKPECQCGATRNVIVFDRAEGRLAVRTVLP